MLFGGIFVGILVGAIIGIVIMALMISSSESEREINQPNKNYMTEISKELTPQIDNKKDDK